MKLERALVAVAVVVACALVAEALWRGPFFPSNDGPHHVFGAFARAHIDDPALNYAAYLTPNAMLTSNGFPDLFSALEPWLGPRDAERAALAVLCALFLAGCVVVSAQVHPARAWLGFVSGSAALGWSLFLGFYPFVIGCAVAFFVLVMGVRASSVQQRVAFSLAMLFLGALHFLVCAVTGGVVLLARVMLVDKHRAREALKVAAAGLPAAALVLYATGASQVIAETDEVLPLVYRITAATTTTLGGAPWRQALFGGVLGTGLVLGAVGFRRRAPLERAYVLVALGALALPLLVPWSFLGWQHGAVRPLALAVPLAIALVPLEALRGRLYPAAACACVAFFAASTWSARATLNAAADDLQDVEAALADPVPGGYRLSAVLVQPAWIDAAGFFRWDPLRGIGSRFAVSGGGLPAYAQTVLPQIHPVLTRADLRANLPVPPMRSQVQSRIRGLDDATARHAALAPLVEQAKRFESVVVLERPGDHALWRAAGFTVASERGRVLSLAVPASLSPRGP